jgi:hypothetical protein
LFWDNRLFNLIQSARFIWKIFSELWIYRVHFTICCALCKQWLLKKLAEYINSLPENFVLYTEVIVGIVFWRCCVFLAGMTLDKVTVVVLFWIFLGSQKQHMFTEVGKPIDSFRIFQVSWVNPEGCCRCLALWVRHENTLHLIFELDVAIG